jgi:hypothetical protein
MADTEQKHRLSSLNRLDGRTLAAREAQAFRSALISDIGGDPSAAQQALIDQAACLHALTGDYGRRQITGELTAAEIPLWLAAINNLRRILETTGMERVAKQVDLQTYLANKARQRPPQGDGEAS